MIDADVHRLQDQHDLVLLGDRGGPLQAFDDWAVHLLLRHARLIVAADDAHLACS